MFEQEQLLHYIIKYKPVHVSLYWPGGFFFTKYTFIFFSWYEKKTNDKVTANAYGWIVSAKLKAVFSLTG